MLTYRVTFHKSGHAGAELFTSWTRAQRFMNALEIRGYLSVKLEQLEF